MSVDPYKLDLERAAGEGMVPQQSQPATDESQMPAAAPSWRERVITLVREHPLAAVGVAAGAAYLLGRLRTT